FKFNGKNQRRILKDILYDYVPKHIFDRPKYGFTLPLKVWFREDRKDYVLSELDYESLQEIPFINPIEVKDKIQQHMYGTWNHQALIWKLIVLKQWLNQHSEYVIK